MNSSKFFIAVMVFTAMAFTGCKKDGVAPIKATVTHQNVTMTASSDSLSGGQEPPVLPN